MDGKLYAYVFLKETVPPGLKFHVADDKFVQVATWNYDAGKHLKAHAHKICLREADLTHEFVFIKQGRLRAHLFDDQARPIESFSMVGGDFAVFFAGGHGYDIEEDHTEVIEVKNGPYPGLEKDKLVIES